jgi:hypothetical protein
MTFEPSDKTCNDVESFLDSVLEAQHCNTGETFILCRLCGEWDSHAETCPVPAVQAWQTGEIPVLSAKGHELRDAAASLDDDIVTLEGLQAYAEARANGLTMFPGLSSPELTEWDDDDAAEWAEDLGRWGRRALAMRALLARCEGDR